MQHTPRLKMRAGSRLIVEARDEIAAARAFRLLLGQDETLTAKIAKVAPKLFYLQTEETGRYWAFVTASDAQRDSAPQ